MGAPSWRRCRLGAQKGACGTPPSSRRDGKPGARIDFAKQNNQNEYKSSLLCGRPKRGAKRHISSKVSVAELCISSGRHIERGTASHIDINSSQDKSIISPTPYEWARLPGGDAAQEQRISFPSPYEWAYCPAALPPRNKQSIFPLSQSVRSRSVPPAPGRAFRAAMPPGRHPATPPFYYYTR